MKSIVAVAASLVLPVKPMAVVPMAPALNPPGISLDTVQLPAAAPLPVLRDAIAPAPQDSNQNLAPTSPALPNVRSYFSRRKASSLPAGLGPKGNAPIFSNPQPTSSEASREQAEADFNRMLGITAPVLAHLTQGFLPAAAQKLSATGYFLGNGIALCVDIPRIYATARSRDPKAVSISANALFMLSSVLSGARGFLGQDLFWAWQNLFSGLMVMAIGVLTNPRVNRFFPQDSPERLRSFTWGASGREYPHLLAAARLLAVCALTALLPLTLGLLGSACLIPLAQAAWSPAVQLGLQIAATTIYLHSYVVQMRKIDQVNSKDGISVWEKRMLIAMGLGLGFWALRNAFLNVGPTMAQTVASLEFWKYFVYFLEKVVGIHVWLTTLRVISKIKKL